ncbi:hypothetical protein BJY01DRAFT_245479 [Aspergillus pseudoustus]|uniref:Rhodopsin domain-containing protein n=1 Tax=Aspergillus pseudoustus TaxID=1810923 RepID=A0ABR4KE37_9EURO
MLVSVVLLLWPLSLANVLKANGFGHDIWMLESSQITKGSHLYYAGEYIYIFCAPLIKISMLLLYLRLFPSYNFRTATYICIAVCVCWAISFLVTGALICRPLSYIWHQWDGEHEGVCLNHNAILIAHAIVNIVLDLVVIGLPIPTLVNLHLGWKKRLGICLMFLIGIV